MKLVFTLAAGIVLGPAVEVALSWLFLYLGIEIHGAGLWSLMIADGVVIVGATVLLYPDAWRSAESK
jgi:hypothetical protein